MAKKKRFYSTELTIDIVSFASKLQAQSVNLQSISHYSFTVLDTYLLNTLIISLLASVTHICLKSCTITVQLAITEMHKELLLLKFRVKHGTESQERSRWSNSSMSQSRHCKHKVTKYRDVKDFRLSKRKKKTSQS